jgi:hypothetical protein
LANLLAFLEEWRRGRVTWLAWLKRGDKGAGRDNVFVQRIWKSVKYEEVYPHAYDGVGVARA